MTLRPERPETAPTRTRIQQIHIPLIIPPPSSPRQPYNPSQPAQPNTHTNKITLPRQPSTPQQPGHHTLPLVPVRPVVETGEAGPPGYVRRVTVRRGSEHSSGTPVKGFAGAPGETQWWPFGFLSRPTTFIQFMFHLIDLDWTTKHLSLSRLSSCGFLSTKLDLAML